MTHEELFSAIKKVTGEGTDWVAFALLIILLALPGEMQEIVERLKKEASDA